MDKRMEHYYKSLLSHLNGEVSYHKGNVMMATQHFKNNILNNSYEIGKKGYGRLVGISNKISNKRKSLEAERGLYEKDKIAFLEKRFEDEISNMYMSNEEIVYSILIDNKDSSSKMKQKDIENFLMSYNKDYANYMKNVEEIYGYGSKEYIQRQKGAIDFYLESARDDLQIKKNAFMKKLDDKYIKKFKKIEKSVSRKDFMFKSIKEKAISVKDYINQKIDKNKSKYSDLEKNQTINREAHENRKQRVNDGVKHTKEYVKQSVVSVKDNVVDKAQNAKDIIVNIDAKKVSPFNVNINKESYIYQSGEKGIESINRKARELNTDAKILGGLANGFVKEKADTVKDKANMVKNGLISKSKSLAKKMHMTKENGSLKTLVDYKRGMKKIINEYKDNVISKAEGVYKNGLEVKDKVVNKANGVKEEVSNKFGEAKSVVDKKAKDVKDIVVNIDAKKVSPFNVNINKESYIYQSGKKGIESINRKAKSLNTDAKILGELANSFVKEKVDVVKDKGNIMKNGFLSKSKAFAKKMHMTKEDGSLKTLDDYKKGAKKIINGYKSKVVSKGEDMYLNGLYVKDKVINTVKDKAEDMYLNSMYVRDRVVDTVVDKAEDTYITGLNVKEGVVSKVNSAKSIIVNKANEVKNVVQSIDTKKVSPFSVNINTDSYVYKAGRGVKRAIGSLGIKGKDFVMNGNEVTVNDLEQNKEKVKVKDMEGLER